MDILSVSVDLMKIDPKRIKIGEKGQKYYDIIVVVNDEKNQYGQDVSVQQGQTKEERDAKAAKVYLGNGKKIFSKAPENVPAANTAHDNFTDTAVADDGSGLPF